MSDETSGHGTQPPSKRAYQEWIFRHVGDVKRKFHERRTKKKNESPQDKAARRTANATVAIAIFTVVAVVVGGLQWRALHDTDEKIGKQIVALNRQLDLMEADQRPYLGITENLKFPEFRPQPSNESYIVWTWEFGNFGKGLAKNISYDQYIKVGDGPYKRSHSEVKARFAGDIAPAKTAYSTVRSQPGFTQEQFTALAGRESGIGLLVEMHFFNESGHQFHNAFCLEKLANLAVALRDPATCKKE